jgi:hypothetical protein
MDKHMSLHGHTGSLHCETLKAADNVNGAHTDTAHAKVPAILQTQQTIQVAYKPHLQLLQGPQQLVQALHLIPQRLQLRDVHLWL